MKNQRRPNWQEPCDDQCQWPRCKKVGQAHYSKGATKWVTPEDGVWLCDAHLRQMSEALWPEQNIPFKLHTLIHIAVFEDYPREAVYANDWFIVNDEITLLVGDSPDTHPDDCQEVPLHMIEEAK